MEMIGKHPGASLRLNWPKSSARDRAVQDHVRKLKKLGLTQSFEVGYEISPRGAK